MLGVVILLVTGDAVVVVRWLEQQSEIGNRVAVLTGQRCVGAEELKAAGCFGVIEARTAPTHCRVARLTLCWEALGLVINRRRVFIVGEVAAHAFRFHRRKCPALVIRVAVLASKLDVGARQREATLFVQRNAVDII